MYHADYTPGFTAMFAQGDIPFDGAPNLINPRIVFEFMSARPGRHLARAQCPVLLVVAQGDDMIPARIGAEIGRAAKDSRFFPFLLPSTQLTLPSRNYRGGSAMWPLRCYGGRTGEGRILHATCQLNLTCRGSTSISAHRSSS